MILPLVFYVLIFFATFTVVCTRIFLSCNCASDFLKVHLLNCPDLLDSPCYCWFILVLSVFKTLAVLSKSKIINLANSLQTVQMIMISFGLTKLY